MTTKNEWFDIARSLDSVAAICETITSDKVLDIEIRRDSMNAAVSLARLAVTIKAHCLKTSALTCSQEAFATIKAELSRMGRIGHG